MSEIIIELPPLYKKQEDALFHPARFVFIEGSTKSGKTAGSLSWQLAQVLTKRNKSQHWWVAPVYDQARIAFRRACSDFEGVYESFTKSPMVIKFRNGSEWHFKSADNPDSLFGEECQSIVIDEATRTKPEAFEACYSTLTTTRGCLRAIGNVKGRHTWHYKECRRAEQGEKDYAYAKLTAQDAVEGGVLSVESLEQAERHLPKEIFRELYFCEPTDNAYSPFGYDNIKKCTTERISNGPAVVYGLDLARKTDYTALIGLNAKGEVCDFYHTKGGDWTVIYNEIEKRVSNRQLIVLDATGIGDPIAEELRKRKLNTHPYVFSANSKQDLMVSLRFAISEHKIRFPQGPIANELESFEYSVGATGKISYSAPDKLHDDCVMALALAYYAGTVITSKVKPFSDAPIEVVHIPQPQRAQQRNARRYR